MQNTGCISKTTQLREDEKQNVMKQLGDIFNCSPNQQLRNLCESQAWNVDRCIDYLIKNNNNDINDNQSKLRSGAIPKNNSVAEKSAYKEATQKKLHSNGNNYALTNNKSQNKMQTNISVEQRIAKLICEGSKVMVLLRGAPGSGKSFLAKSMIERLVPLNDQYTLNDFIFSSDDYFYNCSGVYKWQKTLLDQAHEFNQRQVLERTRAGWSPIFIDNTNIKLWEMMPYVQMAVQNGYVIEILEPKTSWRYSPGKLALKNKHKVPAEKIKTMLNNFEKGTVNDLLKMLKITKYHVTLPQMRTFPPISYGQQDTETDEVFQIYGKENTEIDLQAARATEDISSRIEETAPKSQRERYKQKGASPSHELNHLQDLEGTDDLVIISNKESVAWQPHEQEINNFWNTQQNGNDVKMITRQKECHEKSLLDLLRQGIYDENNTQKDNEQVENAQHSPNLERHSINCPNENRAFASLRQIYPNKEVASMWDLFVKCNGDIDWTVDLLLREDELMSANNSQNTLQVPDIVDNFQCYCFKQELQVEEESFISVTAPISVESGPKPQRQRARATRVNQRSNPELQELTDILANRFVLDGEQFSPHVRKIREMREKQRNPTQKLYASTEVQTEPLLVEQPIDDEEYDVETNEIIEVNLGEGLINQLKNIFHVEMSSLVEKLPENPILNVFMPRTLAKELYMLWVESAYNYLEEQRQNTTREDAHFACLLKNPKYENYKESPENLQELLDMEYARQIYKAEQENEIQRAVNIQQQYQPSDLASHLTQMKLCETFPNIPRETLIEILSAHNNNYDETVRVLISTTQPLEDHTSSDLDKTLVNLSLEEEEIIKAEQHNGKNSEDRSNKVPLQPEEAKHKALHDFEEMRNLAAHHCQLKAECYQKAKEAIQKGNSAVAVYYSQIANFHKMKLDMYNHRAANCIMDVHKYTQNNPELLDLHYLHVMEAIGCLDLFLDRHIAGLRATSRTYKNLFIITGRGLHSSGGVSTIKNKVKSRLKERNLRWSEVNPGLLKVKIFSASKHSKNI
ncbi:NEDD4-binding protein 2 [Ceratitis capitata]|nr:NEDD4-binding protein 2 [Ceratitis capitata]